MKFKNLFARVMIAVALLIAVAGSSGVVEQRLGLDVTPQAYACSSGGGSGGNC